MSREIKFGDHDEGSAGVIVVGIMHDGYDDGTIVVKRFSQGSNDQEIIDLLRQQNVIAKHIIHIAHEGEGCVYVTFPKAVK